MGRLHATNIACHPKARVKTVTDIDVRAATALAQMVGASVANTPQDAIPDASTDVVVITVPATSHAELIILAAQAGKAIFCEKPVDASLDRAARAVEEADRVGVIHFIGFMKRFDRDFETVIRRVQAGDVGAVELVLVTNRDP